MLVVAVVVVAIISVVCILVIVSMMREIVLLRGDVAALSQLITNPPTPSIIGQPLPEPLRTPVRTQAAYRSNKTSDGATASDDLQVVMFMSDSCGSCEELAKSVSRELAAGSLSDDQVLGVIIGGAELTQSSIASILRPTGVAIVPDDGELADACGVRSTPMLLAVHGGTGQAVKFTYGGGVQWIQDQVLRPKRKEEWVTS